MRVFRYSALSALLALVAGAAGLPAQPPTLAPSAVAGMASPLAVRPRTPPSAPRVDAAPGRSRAGRAALGAVLGAVAGGALGYALTSTACGACDDPAPLYAGAALGVGLGALVGIGVALKTDRAGRISARLVRRAPRAVPPNVTLHSSGTPGSGSAAAAIHVGYAPRALTARE
jgi:hypothetical protein